MLQIKTPDIYISEPGAIEFLGSYVSEYGKQALIIWSKTAREVTKEAVTESLESQSIELTEYLFEGYPTLEKAGELAELAKENDITVFIAIGGGKVMDVTKAAGDLANIPVVSVPTIAATCAAWAALSVLYTDEGNFDQFWRNNHSPKAVIADTNILAGAPSRYLRAGIVDTLAKWYETTVSYDSKILDFSYINSINTARLAFEFLKEYGTVVIKNAEENIIDEYTVKTVDAIIFLAGNVGSYVGEKAFSGFAHPFYHSSRIIKETRDTLHGELVAFGLIMQAILERKSEAEIAEIVSRFQELKVAFTLEEIGIYEQTEEKLQIISDRIYELFGGIRILADYEDERALIEAAYQADGYVKKYGREGAYANG